MVNGSRIKIKTGDNPDNPESKPLPDVVGFSKADSCSEQKRKVRVASKSGKVRNGGVD